MAKFDEMDEKVTLSEQLEENVSPVVLINKFNVKPEDADQFLKAWADDAAYFKSQPGFISAQLHRGIGGSGVFVNYAVWESSAQLKKALNNIDLDSHTISSHLQKSCSAWDLCGLTLSNKVLL